MAIQDMVQTDVTTLATVIAGIAAAGFSVLKIYERFFAAKATSAKGDAEASLYETLKQQIESHAKQIGELQSEKALWLTEKSELQNRVNKLEEIEAQNIALKTKLDTKDDQVNSLIREVMSKNDQNNELVERIHMLELRLANDEDSWCKDCRQRKTGRFAIKVGDKSDNLS